MNETYIYDSNTHAKINLKDFGINTRVEKVVALPGFFDVHVHGGYGYAVFEQDINKLKYFLKSLLKEGVSKILITTLTAPIEKTEKYLKWISDVIKDAPWAKEHMASIEGLHLEGPYINKKRKGAQNSEYILNSSIRQIQRWQKISGNNIKLITYAPEKSTISFQEELNKLNIIGSCGHSVCNSSTLSKFVDVGLSHITHTFNATPSLHHREPGIIGEALINEKLNCELISDGYHVCNKVMKILLRNITSTRTQIITDCVFSKSLKDGTYTFEGLKAIKSNETFRLVEGNLAGSISYFNKNVNRVRKLMNWDFNDIVKISSYNQYKEIMKREITIKEMQELVMDFFIFDNNLNPLFYINRLGVKKIWT